MSLTRHYDMRRISLQDDYRHCHELTQQYHATQTLLTQLPKQLTHSIQIPLGPHCFAQGQLVHTNEVQVLLGDNYFIECTSSHAIGICQRRIKHIQAKVKAIQQELDSLNDSIKHSTNLFEQTINEDGEEIIEIKEEYESDDDTNDTNQTIDNNISHTSSNQSSSSSSSLSSQTNNQSIKSSALTGRGNLTDAEFDAYWDMLAETEAQQDNDTTSDQDLDVSNDHDRDEQPDNDVADNSNHIPAIQSPADIFANIQARKQRTTGSPSSSSIKPNLTQSNINKSSPRSSQSSQNTKRVSFNESPSVAHINKLSTTSIPVKPIQFDHPQPVISTLPSSHLDIDGPPSSNPAMRAAFSGSIMERSEPRFDENQTIAPIKKTLSKFKAARMGLIDDDA